jgi:Transposase DDE domain
MWYFNKPIQAWRPTVPHSNQGSVASQVESLQRQFAQAPGLPFADLLPAELITRLLQELGSDFHDRIYTPLVTLAMFLSQCQDADPSQRQAVNRLIAQRVAHKRSACSSNTGAYSKARQRLPEKLLAELTRHTGKQLMTEAPAGWRWKGRHVKIVDGSTASMPDTPANQEEYPQMSCQKPGIGFPILRLLVIFSLAVGTVLDAAFCPYKGKETSELALLRRLHESIDEGDVVLGDRHFCSFFEIAELQRRGADVVLRQHQCRITDFRRGVQLGGYDHLVVWQKPARPDWMDEETYRQYPEELVMREVRVHIKGKGRKVRTRTITIATTLCDHETYRKADLAKLYRRRWQAELNLRSLKTVLQMDVLRCKTPEMVRKEIWAHLLAYNLVRNVMAQAAEEFMVTPWTISFKATLQTLRAFALPLLTCARTKLPEVIEEMLLAIVRHSVGNRPDRVEPRALKRRPKPYDLLTKPREDARKLETQTSCA